MTSLLPTEIANIVASAFNGKLMTGTLRREVSTTVDSDGDRVAGTPLTYQVQGIRESFSAYYATFNNIPNTDVKIMLIANLTVPFTMPLKDDKIYIRSQWHMVRKVLEIDPASASINLQCFEIAAPT